MVGPCRVTSMYLYLYTGLHLHLRLWPPAGPLMAGTNPMGLDGPMDSRLRCWLSPGVGKGGNPAGLARGPACPTSILHKGTPSSLALPGESPPPSLRPSAIPTQWAPEKGG